MVLKNMDMNQIKKQSEQVVLQAGGRICEWLPYLSRQQSRSQDELISRALIINALINIAFQAPIPIIKSWIEINHLTANLTLAEQSLLQKQNENLSEREISNLGWSIEALWALMWAGNLISDLAIDKPVSDRMVELVPNLEKNEDGAKFLEKMRLRPDEELYQMLDLYFRIHWYTEDGRINGYSTGNISSDIVMERRKALEWLMDSSSEWDDIRLST
jgi:hypothetical protein